jgi:hypothetical protein
MEAPVGIDALEGRGEIVGVVDQEPAGLLGEHAQACFGILPEDELGPLDVAGPRLVLVVVGHLGRIVVADAAQCRQPRAVAACSLCTLRPLASTV